MKTNLLNLIDKKIKDLEDAISNIEREIKKVSIYEINLEEYKKQVKECKEMKKYIEDYKEN
uniref:Uncharacterized protein n=1 Tax=viral metagenome TaxID=1070528 RepID=A0A6M3JT01_9ZZZZ